MPGARRRRKWKIIPLVKQIVDSRSEIQNSHTALTVEIKYYIVWLKNMLQIDFMRQRYHLSSFPLQKILENFEAMDL